MVAVDFKLETDYILAGLSDITIGKNGNSTSQADVVFLRSYRNAAYELHL